MAITMNTDLRPIKINLDKKPIWSYDPRTDELLHVIDIYEVKPPQGPDVKMKWGMTLIRVDYTSVMTSTYHCHYGVRINALRRMVQPKFKTSTWYSPSCGMRTDALRRMGQPKHVLLLSAVKDAWEGYRYKNVVGLMVHLKGLHNLVRVDNLHDIAKFTKKVR